MTFDKKIFKERSRRLLDPSVAFLSSLGVSPLFVSTLGLVLGLVAAYAVLRGSLFWGGVFALFSGICDVLDGGIARQSGRESAFGAFIDSTFDRIGEYALYGAMLVYYGDRGYPRVLLVVIWIAMGASLLVSYTRARVEGLGRSCTVGLLERPERFVLLTLGLLLGSRVLTAALTVVAVGASYTVAQRIAHARRATRGDH
jgi:phosphatidylglycerophosphate synthase